MVATLAALPEKDSCGHNVSESVLSWDADTFHDFARHTWSSVIRHRAEITHLLHPMIAWIFDDPDRDVRGHALAVAQAALRAGQPHLTGTDLRFDVDLLGTVLTVLRPKSVLKARGQFYTPGSVAKLLAGMSDIQEHGNVTDPMMGTGGMFRAAAEVMRERDRDPRTIRWIGCDVDSLAVACATVNSMIWNLGTDIVFRTGNTLEPGWPEVALAQREELRRLGRDLERDRMVLSFLRSL
ncbi:N-6 DNA methylase [Amycolatopsis sp. SID8362]|uniref:N-6 DNA methylase n=1 Tax=Amycolatopsis sp. SID8362 TaxID=2690346 RepID=UPI00136E35CF|nr:N-6 DNA methylase [Amycolatopsis sp. SID8362]NBH04550.1 N-6 DNA methylase [Amycolatopsis sp. SID8362]NED41249.1 N-6 DNA methylase [Amycolatopsis sp. SID8362]